VTPTETSATSPTALSGSFLPLPPLDVLERQWRDLEADSNCSFFQSWGWIGPWLRLVGSHHALLLYECRDGPTVVALAVFGLQEVRRRAVLRLRTFWLNETASPPDLFIEYNGCLARAGFESAALLQMARDAIAQRDDWDEIRLSNIPEDVWNRSGLDATGLRVILDETRSTWVAPLQYAARVDDILARLRKSRRTKISRSFREYGRLGNLGVRAASDVEEAIDQFHDLGELHTRRWNRAGLAGSFADAAWVRFHEDVIATGFPRGDVQMLRICCDERPIGYIYNFVWRGTVLMLQSGFAQETSNHLRPGYVSHILAMQHNAKLGNRHYDFLVGDADYKEVLAERRNPLVSARLQRPLWQLSLENAAIRMYRRLRLAGEPWRGRQ
jgi:CelD/BcsL family acetyltransferase involved in cellulose biosynthesis